MKRIHPRHHVRRRREPAVTRTATLRVAPDIAETIEALGINRKHLDQRIRQAVQLEAFQVSEGLVNTICKISSQGRLTQEDITMLHYHATGGTTP